MARNKRRFVRLECRGCRCRKIDKGRAMDGRRCYRCQHCGSTWSSGLQGRKPKYSDQRNSFQFHDTGAATRKDCGLYPHNFKGNKWWLLV